MSPNIFLFYQCQQIKTQFEKLSHFIRKKIGKGNLENKDWFGKGSSFLSRKVLINVYFLYLVLSVLH